jgi:hypothetical protein
MILAGKLSQTSTGFDLKDTFFLRVNIAGILKVVRFNRTCATARTHKKSQ